MGRWRTLDAQPKPAPAVDAPVPHDPNAEALVLGAAVIDGKVSPRFANLRPEFFFNDWHRVIFAAMIRLEQRGNEITLPVLQAELCDCGELDAAGGLAYVLKLDDGVPAINQGSFAAKRIIEKYRQRQMIRVFYDAWGEAYHRDPEMLHGEVVNFLETLRESVHEKTEAPVLGVADMPESVLDQVLGDVCRRRLLSRGFPIAYAWPALLTVAGTLVLPTPSTPTNLFCCLVGPVGSGKTICIESAIRLLNLEHPRLQPVNAGSAEGLFANLESAAGDGRLISPDELAHLLLKAGLDGASFPSLLNRAYSKNEFDLIVRRGKKFHVNCRLAIIGGVVDDNFQSAFGAATTAGLYDRFAFGLCPRPHKFFFRPFEGPTLDLEPCDVRIDPEVYEAVREWIKENPAMGDGRPIELALRAATIAAAFSGNSVLHVKHLGPARAFAEYQVRVRALLRPNPGQTMDAQCAFAILSTLSSGHWADEREVSKKIHSERFGPGIFRRAIENLEFNREIEKSIHGRRSQIRRLV